MKYILDILVEQRVFDLNKPFYYSLESNVPVKPGVRAEVNFSNHDLIGFVLNVKEYHGDNILKDYPGIKEVNSIIDEEPIINDELFEVAKFVSKRYVCPLIAALQAILPKSLKPSSSSKNAAKVRYFTYFELTGKTMSVTPKQQELLDEIKAKGRLLKSEASVFISKKLLDLGLIKEVKVEATLNLKYSNNDFKDFVLTDDQKQVYEDFKKTNKTTSLLYGVTGSGKTEIYIKLIEDTIKYGRTAVLLVPEINLTPYFCDMFSYYFKDQVAILTSGLTDFERYAQFRNIVRGKAKLVIGTRSAIFAPLKNIGLIIIDEEFSENYKQDDDIPHYHAIEVAKFRCKQNNAKLLLGTATPSIDSMARAKNGQYELLKLNKRYNNLKLPNAKIINMANLDNLMPGCSFLSLELVYAMKQAIMKDQQVILLLNRKGYSNYSVCDECFETIMCDNCHHPLTYYKRGDFYKCNRCGTIYNKNDLHCKCGNDSFIDLGFGIEALEEALSKIFPNEKILRLDNEIAAKPKQIARILDEFRAKKSHILIGTEMLAKGHDFTSVAVIGIVCADQLLNMPFYNTNERLFQLITQCIGRCGRGDEVGQAYIQTNTLDSYAINIAAAQDYDLFYEKEIKYREMSANPPYFYVSTFKISGLDLQYLRNYTAKLRTLLMRGLKGFYETIYIKKGYEKDHKKYITTIVIKYKKQKEVLEFFNSFMEHFKTKNNIHIKINIDPSSF